MDRNSFSLKKCNSKPKIINRIENLVVFVVRNEFSFLFFFFSRTDKCVKTTTITTIAISGGFSLHKMLSTQWIQIWSCVWHLKRNNFIFVILSTWKVNKDNFDFGPDQREREMRIFIKYFKTTLTKNEYHHIWYRSVECADCWLLKLLCYMFIVYHIILYWMRILNIVISFLVTLSLWKFQEPSDIRLWQQCNFRTPFILFCLIQTLNGSHWLYNFV